MHLEAHPKPNRNNTCTGPIVPLVYGKISLYSFCRSHASFFKDAATFGAILFVAVNNDEMSTLTRLTRYVNGLYTPCIHDTLDVSNLVRLEKYPYRHFLRCTESSRFEKRGIEEG